MGAYMLVASSAMFGPHDIYDFRTNTSSFSDWMACKKNLDGNITTHKSPNERIQLYFTTLDHCCYSWSSFFLVLLHATFILFANWKRSTVYTCQFFSYYCTVLLDLNHNPYPVIVIGKFYSISKKHAFVCLKLLYFSWLVVQIYVSILS